MLASLRCEPFGQSALSSKLASTQTRGSQVVCRPIVARHGAGRTSGPAGAVVGKPPLGDHYPEGS